ncbi:immunoglobulin superfamily DCC subclass member 3-like [Dermochelys coriacea]|uniref:immunoglobulin superfamily DCC subclass member 3-like n=1 Tax=Dermochelys coriacea TaxID=27794 RepID=UPI001CA98BEA|nr:immunoglobulin superfamily DCC subclass member 3-like [Dermochelys coriacea]
MDPPVLYPTLGPPPSGSPNPQTAPAPAAARSPWLHPNFPGESEPGAAPTRGHRTGPPPPPAPGAESEAQPGSPPSPEPRRSGLGRGEPGRSPGAALPLGGRSLPSPPSCGSPRPARGRVSGRWAAPPAGGEVTAVPGGRGTGADSDSDPDPDPDPRAARKAAAASWRKFSPRGSPWPGPPAAPGSEPPAGTPLRPGHGPLAALPGRAAAAPGLRSRRGRLGTGAESIPGIVEPEGGMAAEMGAGGTVKGPGTWSTGWRLGRPSELAFLLEPADVIVVQERPLVLHCWVEGEPPISITWHKDGAVLGNDSHVAVLANGSLLIESFHHQPRSGGTANQTSVGGYSCAAQNRDGLLVSRKARVQFATLSKFHMHPASMAVEEGGVARFQCLIQGVPEATITWEHNRTALPPSDHRFTLLPAGILQITGVQRADVGSYRCVASNIANSRCSQEAQLAISGELSVPKLYKEPMILSGPQNLTITVHQTAILECIATGNPRPIVSWSRLDGRSIGVEGIQVLGTGNLMISDVSVKHAGVYVCAANRPGTRVRRTAQGILMVQAPPEFVQWPQSVSKPLGSRAIFTCVAQGVPEPQLIWLKNGKILAPGENIKLTHKNSTLLLQGLTAGDEAIYQCIAENSVGTNQASARLALTLAQELPSSPEGIRATALSTTSIQVSWQAPPPEVTEGLIGYVLNIRRAGESDSRELQEAVSKTTFQHLFTGLAPATTYCLRLRAWSPLGASQDSEPVLATTMGSIPAAPSFFTKVLNASAVQVFWALPSQPGRIEGFKLFHRKLPSPHLEGPQLLASTANSYLYSNLEPLATYELQLQAFNGNGDSNSTVRVVRLEGSGQTLDADPGCHCRPEESSLAGSVGGVHIGMASIILCLLFLVFGYCRR